MAASVHVKNLIAQTVALGLIAVLGTALSVPRVLRGGADQPVTLTLPEQLGPYRGENIFFCQNDQCLSQFEENVLENTDECPRCQSPLGLLAPGELINLPKNTPILRKNYHLAGEPSVNVTLVFSGTERRSIHRPQVCLAAQGFAIRDEQSRTIDMHGRPPLQLRVLDVVLPLPQPDGTHQTFSSVYTYWFFNPERETPYHINRLIRMAYDNIFRNYRPRWAYVMVATPRTPHGDEQAEIARIERFLRLVMPVIDTYRDTTLAAEADPPQA